VTPQRRWPYARFHVGDGLARCCLCGIVSNTQTIFWFGAICQDLLKPSSCQPHCGLTLVLIPKHLASLCFGMQLYLYKPMPTVSVIAAPIYESTATNNTYLFNTMQLNQSESYCQDSGGHLVSYAGADEQIEVEGYYIDKV
jgi:hypothetical protein